MLKYSRSNPNLGSRMKEEEGKHFTRVLSKESSVANPSFRVYYGDVPSAVPFVWETQPGTPKHNFFPKDHDLNPPTLRPPPCSYFTPSRDHKPTKTHDSMSRSTQILFNNLKNMVPPFKKNQLSSSPSSSSSSSSSYSSIATPSSDKVRVYQRRRARLLSIGSAFDDHDIYEFSAARKKSSHKSMLLCFGIHL